MAISCFAIPLDGRPTRRARRSSSGVESGISEKSICASGIGLAFPPTRRPRADDSERFFFIFYPSYGIHHEHQSFAHRLTKSFESVLLVGVCKVVPVKPVDIAKDRCRFFKRHAMLFKIGDRLHKVPSKHQTVYTVIGISLQSTSRYYPPEHEPNYPSAFAVYQATTVALRSLSEARYQY